jgi:hypothetical protein
MLYDFMDTHPPAHNEMPPSNLGPYPTEDMPRTHDGVPEMNLAFASVSCFQYCCRLLLNENL